MEYIGKGSQQNFNLNPEINILNCYYAQQL